MKKIKIALVYDAIYPYIKGGGEKRFYEIGKRLAKKGHQVHLYGMKFWDGDRVIKKKGMYYHGICMPKYLYKNNGKRSIKEAIYFGFICLKLIKEDFDVIDCCGFPYFSLFSCKIVSLIKRKQLFSTWHEVWGAKYWKSYLGHPGIFGYLVEKLSARMPDRIISVSEHTTNKLKNDLFSKKDIITISNGVDFEKIRRVPASSEKSDVIFAGRLFPNKNVDVLIKSIAVLKKSIPDIKCLIIGEGSEKKKLIGLSQRLNLEKNIVFLGFLDNHDDVCALMKSSRVFMLPSTREGFGMVVIEANACGIPVITIDHQDNAARDLIEEGENGFACQLNEREIAKRIMRILENSSGRKMEEACIDLAKKYDWDKIVDEIEGVYSK